MNVSKEKDSLDWPKLVTKSEDWKKNHKGWLAELKRVKTLDEIADRPAYYRLLQGVMPAGRIAERVAFLLPWLPHKDGAESLGQQFQKAKVSEMRLFQVLRSESPGDLEMLRRLIQQTKAEVDWKFFSQTMKYWGKYQKRQLLEHYFLTNQKSNKKD